MNSILYNKILDSKEKKNTNYVESLDIELNKEKINPSLRYALKQFWEKLFQNDISKKEEKTIFF